MKNIIYKKDHQLPVLVIVHILMFFLLKLALQVQFNKVENTNPYDYYDAQKLEEYLGLIYFCSSLIIIYNLYNDIKSDNNSISKILIFFLVSYVFYVFEDVNGLSIPFHTKRNDSLTYYSYYYSFLPYCFLIFKYSIIGIKEDITLEIKERLGNKHHEKLDDLDTLLSLDLLSTKQHKKKKKKEKLDKIKADLKETEEYNLLTKSKIIGLLTEQEFDDKVSFLMKKKYKDSKN